MLSAPLAFATPPEVPPAVTAAKAAIEKDLVTPLTVKERKQSRMTRSRQPAMARRIRVLGHEPSKDAAGKAFLSFAVDAKYGFDPMDEELIADPALAKKLSAAEKEEKNWQKDAITGCLYPDSGEIFVNRGGTWYPGTILLGKKGPKPAEGVCRAGAEQVAQK